MEKKATIDKHVAEQTTRYLHNKMIGIPLPAQKYALPTRNIKASKVLRYRRKGGNIEEED